MDRVFHLHAFCGYIEVPWHHTANRVVQRQLGQFLRLTLLWFLKQRRLLTLQSRNMKKCITAALLLSFPLFFTLHTSPYTLHHSHFTLHLSHFTIHASPYTRHPTPFTLHPSPFTLHHSRFTLHTSPFTLHHSYFTLHLSYFTLHTKVEIFITLKLHTQYKPT